MVKYLIYNEMNVDVGTVFWDALTNTYSICWLCQIIHNGCTEDGVKEWADRMGYHLR